MRWARRSGWRAPDNADAAHLAAAALAGDEVACAAFERAGHAVGLAIAATAALCDLDLAVIGGGIARLGSCCSIRFGGRSMTTLSCPT